MFAGSACSAAGTECPSMPTRVRGRAFCRRRPGFRKSACARFTPGRIFISARSTSIRSRFHTTRPIPSGSPLTVRGCAAAWRRISGTSARRGCARFPAVRRWCWRPITMWTWFAAGRIPSGSSSGFSDRGGTSTTRTAPARCASWRKAERAPSFFLTFLLTIIYLNWHIIRYAARFRRRASTWETISASAFPGGTGFPTC